jgi:hypothetical protein
MFADAAVLVPIGKTARKSVPKNRREKNLEKAG